MFESWPVKYWKNTVPEGRFLGTTGKKVLETPSTMTTRQKNKYYL